MRRAARVDENHGAIVKALRAHGYSVQSLAAVGKGVPDLLVGCKGVTLLLEVKDGAKAPSKRRLTEDETRWFGAWGGHRAIVESPEQAVAEVKRHLAEVQGPGWTAALWYRAGHALRLEARRKRKAGLESSAREDEAQADQAEAMARALGGGG